MSNEKYLSPEQEKEYVASQNARLAAPDFGGKGVVVENTTGSLRYRFLTNEEAKAAEDAAAADRKSVVDELATIERLQKAQNAPPDQIAATVGAKAAADAQNKG